MPRGVNRISFLLAPLWVQAAVTRERHEAGLDAQMVQGCERGPFRADWEERDSLFPPRNTLKKETKRGPLGRPCSDSPGHGTGTANGAGDVTWRRLRAIGAFPLASRTSMRGPASHHCVFAGSDYIAFVVFI